LSLFFELWNPSSWETPTARKRDPLRGWLVISPVAWSEPTRGTPLRWGDYKIRYGLGLTSILFGWSLFNWMVASSLSDGAGVEDIWLELVLAIIYLFGWLILPGSGARRGLALIIAFLGLAPLSGGLVLLLAWLIVRERPRRSYLFIAAQIGMSIGLAIISTRLIDVQTLELGTDRYLYIFSISDAAAFGIAAIGAAWWARAAAPSMTLARQNRQRARFDRKQAREQQTRRSQEQEDRMPPAAPPPPNTAGRESAFRWALASTLGDANPYYSATVRRFPGEPPLDVVLIERFENVFTALTIAKDQWYSQHFVIDGNGEFQRDGGFHKLGVSADRVDMVARAVILMDIDAYRRALDGDNESWHAWAERALNHLTAPR
jgi:hypothetical protein